MKTSTLIYKYVWSRDKLRCNVIVKAPFKKGIKRNVLIELDNGLLVVVPWRSLRRAKNIEAVKGNFYNANGAKYGLCPECSNYTYLDGGMPLCLSCGWSKYPEY